MDCVDRRLELLRQALGVDDVRDVLPFGGGTISVINSTLISGFYARSTLVLDRGPRYGGGVTNRERPRARRASSPLYELAPGVYVETSPFEAREIITGAEVHVEVGWLEGRPVIDVLTITRGADSEIYTTILRNLSLPALLDAALDVDEEGVHRRGVRLWADSKGTIPFDPLRQDGENLEQWAARLAYAATAMGQSPAEYIAETQGIEVSTARQRLVTARKMGLIGSGKKEGS